MPQADVKEAYCGSERRVKLTLPSGAYTSGTALQAQCWPGDDRPVLFNPACAWIDPAERTIAVTIAAAQTATLAPGTYPVRLGITAPAGAVAWVPAFLLKLLAAPGTRPARPAYCSYDDLRLYAGGWLDALYSQGDAAQAGAAEERAAARAEFEAHLHGRFGGSGSQLVFAGASLIPSGGLGVRSPWLAGLLDAGRLVVSEPVRRWNVLWALQLVCRRQIAAKGGKGEDPYRRLAEGYRDEADALLPTIVAEVDADGDGVGDLPIAMGVTRILRG